MAIATMALVESWCDTNPKEAQAEFEALAAEVITKLRKIEAEVLRR